MIQQESLSLPLKEKIRLIHFTGIGGIGMSALAQVLKARGYDVQGSDTVESSILEILRAQGINSFVGHDENYLEHVNLLVYSSAISVQNPEIKKARALSIPLIHRGDMLKMVMEMKKTISISGTHGKTTTTSLIATLLDLAQFDPTVLNGGIMNRYDSNIRLGDGDWMVVEADESDGTLIKLPTTVSVLTNINSEHMEFYKTTTKLEETFTQFVTQIPLEGASVLCLDNLWIKAILEKVTRMFPHHTFVTYGLHEDAHVRAENIHFTSEGMQFDAVFLDGTCWKDMKLSLYGEHNVLNALACLAVGLFLKIPEEVVRLTLSSFAGVKRRFTCTGTVKGVTVIDDYAHHPVEIQAVLKVAKKICKGRVIAVCQPHRYSRFTHLFEEFQHCFQGADDLVLLPVYGAGEAPSALSSIDLKKMVKGIPGVVECLNNFEETIPYLKSRVTQDDMVICLGAGTITQLASQLPSSL